MPVGASRVRAARERAEGLIARVCSRVPAPLLERALARSAVEVDGVRLDAQVQWADVLRRLARHRPIEHGSVAYARREYRRMRLLEREPPPLARIEERHVEGPAGRIPVRVYQPVQRTGGALLFFHGGGGVIGDLESHDVVCRSIAARGELSVIAVDYRLAPEHAYTAACDDALAAYRWVRAQAQALGVDGERIAVGGDSRGGKLAAVLCHLARAHGVPQPRVQVLIYPATDLVGDYPSRARFAAGPWLTGELMQWFERHAFEGVDRADPRVSPLLSRRFDDLAPAIVVVAGFDPLRDEGRAYAQRLRDAGVPVHLTEAATLPHGFVQLTGVSRAAARATDAIIDELRAMLAATR